MLAENYRIFTDATTDFPAGLREWVQLLPMQITFGEETLEYAADWDQARLDGFYARLKAGELPTTSQIAPFAYEAAFEPILAEGQDVLYLCFSSGLSNSYASAQVAAANLAEKYPQRRVALFDTRSATFAQCLLVEKAVANQQEGMSLEESLSALEAERRRIACWFTVSDLMYLRHGGRISAAAAVIGTTLRIMPVMRIDEAGKLPVVDKVQGRKTALRALLRLFQETVDAPQDQVVYLVHSGIEDALLMEKMVRQAVPQVKDVHVGTLGPVIGAHTGPGTLGIIFKARV